MTDIDPAFRSEIERLVEKLREWQAAGEHVICVKHQIILGLWEWIGSLEREAATATAPTEEARAPAHTPGSGYYGGVTSDGTAVDEDTPADTATAPDTDPEGFGNFYQELANPSP